MCIRSSQGSAALLSCCSRKPLEMQNSITAVPEKINVSFTDRVSQHQSNVSEAVFFICSQNSFGFFLNPVIILLYNTIISYCDICLSDKE